MYQNILLIFSLRRILYEFMLLILLLHVNFILAYCFWFLFVYGTFFAFRHLLTRRWNEKINTFTLFFYFYYLIRRKDTISFLQKILLWNIKKSILLARRCRKATILVYFHYLLLTKYVNFICVRKRVLLLKRLNLD